MVMKLEYTSAEYAPVPGLYRKMYTYYIVDIHSIVQVCTKIRTVFSLCKNPLLFLFVNGKFHITAHHECSGTDGQGRAIFKHNGSLFTADTDAINGRQCTA